MKPKLIFASPGKTEFLTSINFLNRFEHANGVFILKCDTVPCRIFRGTSFKSVITCAGCVHLQYRCQYMAECKFAFFDELMGQIIYIF